MERILLSHLETKGDAIHVTLVIPVRQIVGESKNSLLKSHESWERVRLVDIATVQNGYAFRSSSFSKTKGLPLIRIRDIGESFTECMYDGPYEEKYVVNPDDLLVGMDGNFSLARWGGKKALLNQRVCKISLSTEYYDPDFLELVLPGYLNEINRHTSSLTVKHLSSTDIEDIPLPLPPIAEQRRIVVKARLMLTRISSIDAMIAEVIRRLSTYEMSYLEMLYSGALSSRPVNEGHLTNERSDLPSDWKRVKLKDIKSFSLYGPRYSSDAYSVDGYPVLRTSDIREDGTVDLTNAPRLRLTGDELKRYRVLPGDLLITRTGSIGTLAVYDDSIQAIPGAYLISYRLDVPRATVWYVYHYLRSLRGQQHLKKASAGVGRPNISAPKIDAIEIPMAPFEEQKLILAAITEVRSTIRDMRLVLQDQLRRVEWLRSSILSEAFSGNLVAQDPKDEPAVRLLKLITSIGKASRSKKHTNSR